MIDQFKQWYDNRHEYARQWKERTGGKVVACLCTYVPEELLYAAGVLPVRIYGSHEPSDVTEPHIFGMYCPYCRDCLAQVIEGRYDYVDGVIIGQACLHLRQVFFSWDIHRKRDFMYYMYTPIASHSPHARPYLRKEIENLKRALEEWTGKPITDEDLDRAIELVNANRRMLRQLFELRQQENPPILGYESLYVTTSGQMVHKEDHNRALEQLLKELPNRQLNREVGPRLMVTGSENDDIEFARMVEEDLTMPATIVVEEACTSARYFWNDVVPEEDRLMALAKRYLERPPCPTKDWIYRRSQFVLDLARAHRVEGAIVMQQKFCDPHEIDIPFLRQELEDNGIKTYFLEFDVTVPYGQFKIRVEAFLEVLRAEELPFD